MSKNCIMVFEDKESNLEDLVDPLEAQIDQDEFYIEAFKGDRSKAEDETETEFVTRLLREEGHPVLVVLDAELNKFENSSIRKANVREACNEAGVPLCVYHRDEGEYSDPESIKESEQQIIRLDPKEGHEAMANSCAVIAKSFKNINQVLTDKVESNSPRYLLEAPSKVLEDMTQVPVNARGNLDKYSWGQPEGLIKEEGTKEDSIRRKSTSLGYWIYNQLLEYPGVLLNTAAASSYLGVDYETFQESTDCQSLLDKARYKGPFGELENWWWTAEIDGILRRNTTPDDGEIISGREYFLMKGYEIDPVKCLEGEEGAGYYCVLSEEPVCEEHSVSPEAWIPAGASLSRISESEYMKISGWD